jgi:Retroviral aspartyl protease
MIDSMSTYSLINPTLVHNLSLSLLHIAQHLLSLQGHLFHLCADLEFYIQGHLFQVDLRVLYITDYDVILGIDWLSNNSPMKIN